MVIKIGDCLVGGDNPTYFIADIAANHDGDIDRARLLIKLAKEAGADAVKFQNFQAEKIICKEAFDNMVDKNTHQAGWKKSVYKVYKDASIPFEWTKELNTYCRKVGIDYMSTPYDFEAVDMLDEYIPAYKIGSGDITWTDMLEYIAKKNKPVLLATGAADISDVKRAVDTIQVINKDLILMQCNTNYTGNKNNLKYLNLNVLKTYQKMYPDLVLGLSDHTHGPVAVLGAISLGAKVIERHFTDDNSREGPDHKFATNPTDWKQMITDARAIEVALGDGIKRVEDNEKDSIIVQQRSLHAAKDIFKGDMISESYVVALRPAQKGSFKPYQKSEVLGKKATSDIKKGESFTIANIQ